MSEVEQAPLFVYGTLLFGEVLDRVVGRRPDSRRAAAPGYAVRRVPGQSYPGMIADPRGVAGGLLLAGLSALELRALDLYEGDEYRRTSITVVDETGAVLEVETYLADEAGVSEETWTSPWFLEHHLDPFLASLEQS